MCVDVPAIARQADGDYEQAQRLFSRALAFAKKTGNVLAVAEYGSKARQMGDRARHDSTAEAAATAQAREPTAAAPLTPRVPASPATT